MVKNPEQYKPGTLVRYILEPSFIAIVLEKPHRYNEGKDYLLNWSFMSVKIIPVGKHISQFERIDLEHLEILSP